MIIVDVAVVDQPTKNIIEGDHIFQQFGNFKPPLFQHPGKSQSKLAIALTFWTARRGPVLIFVFRANFFLGENLSPRRSMYDDTYLHENHTNQPNVGKYIIHGSSGFEQTIFTWKSLDPFKAVYALPPFNPTLIWWRRLWRSLWRFLCFRSHEATSCLYLGVWQTQVGPLNQHGDSQDLSWSLEIKKGYLGLTLPETNIASVWLF